MSDLEVIQFRPYLAQYACHIASRRLAGSLTASGRAAGTPVTMRAMAGPGLSSGRAAARDASGVRGHRPPAGGCPTLARAGRWWCGASPGSASQRCWATPGSTRRRCWCCPRSACRPSPTWRSPGCTNCCGRSWRIWRELPEPQSQALAGALGLAPSSQPDRLLICAAVLGLLAAAAEDPARCCAWSTTRNGWTGRRPTRWCSRPGGCGPSGSRSCSACGSSEAGRFEAAGLPELVLDRAVPGRRHERAGDLGRAAAPSGAGAAAG